MLILNLFVSILIIFQTLCILTTIGQHLHSNNNDNNANLQYNNEPNDKKLDHHPSPTTDNNEQIINNNNINNNNEEFNDNSDIDFNPKTGHAVASGTENQISSLLQPVSTPSLLLVHQRQNDDDGADGSHRQRQPNQKQEQSKRAPGDANQFLRPRRSSVDDLLTEKSNRNLQTDRDLFATTSSCLESVAAGDESRLDSLFLGNYQRRRVPCLDRKINLAQTNLYRTFYRNLFKLSPQALVNFLKDGSPDSPIDEAMAQKFLEKINLSGAKPLPFYVQEPDYLLVNRKLPSHLSAPDYFIPPRGRKNDRTNNLLDLQDQFFPNRGKKSPSQLPIKKGSAENLLARDLFVPNRGKKLKGLSPFDGNEDGIFYPNRGKKLMDDYYQQQSELDSMYKSMGWKRGGLNSLFQDNDLFVPNRGKKSSTFGKFMENEVFMPNRGKKSTGNSLEKLMKEELFIPNRGRKKRSPTDRERRDLLSSLAKSSDQDPFYAARGRRVPVEPEFWPAAHVIQPVTSDSLPAISHQHHLIATNKIIPIDISDNNNDGSLQNYRNYDFNELTNDDKLLFWK